MAKVVVAMLCFFMLFAKGRAQQAELDSLQRVLAQYNKDDTVKVNLLNNIAYDYASINPALGIKTADKAIALATKLNSLPKMATAYNYKGVNYAAQGDDTLALVVYGQALALHTKTNNTLRIGTTCNNIAISLVNLSRYAEALGYHAKALAIFENLHDERRTANSLNNIGVIYLYIADYDKALDYYLKALRLLEKNGDKTGIKNAYTNIGLVYDHLSDFSKSLQYHTRAFEICRQNGDKAGMAGALGNMGNVYNDMDSSAKALELYKQALDISNALGDKRGIAGNYGNIGIVYSGMGNYTLAMDFLQRALALDKAAGDRQRMAGDFNQLAKLYLNSPAATLAAFGIPAAQRYARVVDCENHAIALAKEAGATDLQRDAWQTLSAVYEAQGSNAALAAYKQYVMLRDSVINGETRMNVIRKEMQFDFEKREALAAAESDKRQAVADEEISRQRIVRNAVAGGTAVLAVAAFTTFVFYKKRRDALEIKKEAEFSSQVIDTEMKALRAQMNPHFIFNSLNSISDYMHTHDTVKAAGYTVKFAKLMRMILENSGKKEVTIAEDLEALELYMQLEQLRLRGKFTYTMKLDEQIDAENTFIPPLLMQPFVENSIWHGLAAKPGTGSIIISISLQGNMLHCTIEDDGIGEASLTAQNLPAKQNQWA